MSSRWAMHFGHSKFEHFPCLDSIFLLSVLALQCNLKRPLWLMFCSAASTTNWISNIIKFDINQVRYYLEPKNCTFTVSLCLSNQCCWHLFIYSNKTNIQQAKRTDNIFFFFKSIKYRSDNRKFSLNKKDLSISKFYEHFLY